MNGRPGVRIGDAEREGAVWALGEHYAVGRLSETEYDERSSLAWSARTHADLAPLFSDLPQPHGRPMPVAAWSSARPLPPPLRPVTARPGPRWAPLAPLLAVLIVLATLSVLPWLVVALVVWLGVSHCSPGHRRVR